MIKKKEKNKKETSKKVDKLNSVIKVISHFAPIFIFHEVYSPPSYIKEILALRKLFQSERNRARYSL